MTPTSASRPSHGRGLLGPALTLVHTGRAPTRAVLTAELGVTRATAGTVAAELQELGLVTVDARPSATDGVQGRPSHRLSVAPDGPAVLAAQVHADGYRAAVVGLGGHLVASTPDCRPVGPDPATTLREIVADGLELLRRTGRRCAGAGLAVPSAVAEPDGTALNPLHVAWPSGVAVRDVFRTCLADAGLKVPAFAANDVNLAALAEHRHGAGRGARHLLVVGTGHRGVGGALVVDGRLYTGSSGLALEVGHLTVDPGGRACHCGGRGCLDVETDPLALLRAAGAEPPEGVSLVDAAAGALRGARQDPAALPAVLRVVDLLGLGLAGLVNILAPDRIVLVGVHRAVLESYGERLRGVVAQRSLWARGGSVPLLPATLAHNSLVGAAELAWQPVLDDPVGAMAP